MKLRVASLLLVAACSSSAPAPKTTTTTPASETASAPGSFRIGDLTAYALEEGHLEVPNDGTVLGFPAKEAAEVLGAAGLPSDKIGLDIQCLLVDAGDRVILFDTGMGDPSPYPGSGLLMKSFAAAGLDPAKVTDVFISHVHGDHIGGLVTKDGALAFPSATVHLSAPEWAFWQKSTEENDKRIVAAIAPKVDAFEPGAQVLPLVKAVATPGHTPGHSSYEIGSGADKVFYVGDVVHHSVISVQRPDWSIKFDMDDAAAKAMRKETLAKLAADGTRVFAVHFPFPGVGHVVAEGDGFVWKPEAR